MAAILEIGASSQFLKDNALDSVGADKVFSNASLDELVELTSKELREYAKEVGLGVIERKRLIKGIKKLKGKTPTTPNTPSLTTSLSNRSSKSRKANKAEDSDDSIEDMSMKITEAMNALESQSLSCKDEIRKLFYEFRNKLQERELKLLQTVDQTSENKKRMLEAQLDFNKENEKANGTGTMDLATDANISFFIDRDEFLKAILTVGFIKGAAEDPKEAQERMMQAKQKEVIRQQFLTVEKLKQVSIFEKECAQQRTDSIRFQSEVEIEIRRVKERTQEVEAQLEIAEPMLEEAKKSVSKISKKQLGEMKALKKPPAVIELVLTAVAVMLGHKIKTWRDIQKCLADGKFVPKLLGFETSTFTKKQREHVQKKYASHTDFNFERVNKASKAAGPLLMWVQSQIKYSEILDTVRPMQKETKQLQKRLAKKQRQAQKCMSTVRELELKTSQCRTDINEMVENMINLQDKFEVNNMMNISK